MIRFLVLLLLVNSVGCADDPWPPQKMLAPVEVPSQKSSIDPWVAELLKLDVAEARKHLNDRLACKSPELSPLIQTMDDYVPVQVVFSSDVGYLRCVRKYKDQSTAQSAYDVMYIAQPVPEDRLESRVAYFDRDVQSLARELLKRFAGSGEEMEGTAGQFALRHWPSVSDFNSRDANSYGDWRDAKLLYAAMNGDSVFIRPNGATAWHTLETDEMSQIANTLEEFIQVYADFRKTHEIFDSWAYRKFQSDRTKR